MKKIMLLSAMMGCLISANTFAHNIQPNQLLANVTVSDKGEITLMVMMWLINLGAQRHCLAKSV